MTQEDDFTTQEDFEASWTAARRRAGIPDAAKPGPSKELNILPIVVAYTGLFFGPLGTLLVALHVTRWRPSPRMLFALIGAAGTVLLLNYAVTLGFGAKWTPFELQLMRSILNFIFAGTTYVLLKRQLRETHVASRGTIHRTLATVVVLVALYFAIGPNTLILLGR
jgi:hypothetical protein